MHCVKLWMNTRKDEGSLEYLDGVAGLLICYMMLNHIILRANIGLSVDNVWLEPVQFFRFWFFYKSGMFYKPQPTNQLLVSGGS